MKEKLNKKEGKPMNIEYKIIRPGGNDTALVIGLNGDPQQRKIINDAIMAQNPNVEQVGFVNLDIENVELMMAGGEFCGNATRSTAWLALNGQPGELEIKVSGVCELLKAGVKENGDSWAQMPIYQSPDRITIDDDGNAIVEMDGITQVIMNNPFEVVDEEEVKTFAYQKLSKMGLLDSVPAAGVMLVSAENGVTKIDPVVWVRDIQTLFYESACGSGTTAVGLVRALMDQSSISQKVLQPSGMAIEVVVEFDSEQFSYAAISGPVEQLATERQEI
ncbi:MAG: hypothetical protein OEX81_04855 [Candidatus Pacebacteria bacterium]|nr:hypothetical protein [Candidatus Paceibacterota bacterium]